MPFTLATWNINSVRLREALVSRLLTGEAPDVLCLQEIKTPLDKFPLEGFAAAGYRHVVARGQKGMKPGLATRLASFNPLGNLHCRSFSVKT